MVYFSLSNTISIQYILSKYVPNHFLDQEVTTLTNSKHHPNQLQQQQQFPSHSNSFFINNNNGLSSSTYNQPYRYGGRVGLFGHYLRSLKIILLLTCLKLDAMVYSTCSNSSSNGSKVEHLLKSICELAADLDGIERRYVKKGQRLLFCGPDLMSLVSKCTEIRVAFDAFHGEFMVYFDIYIYR